MKLHPMLGVAVCSLALFGGCASPGRSAGGKAALLAEGATAPDLEGVDQNGTRHRLRDLDGKPVVVYFYPKDETPGCTKEACAFRDVWSRYQKAGVSVFGVSSDTQASHQRFAQKHSLPFPLIADPDGEWGKAFGVPRRMGMYQRVTFLVGRDGKVARVYPNVDPGVHAAEVLEAAEKV